MQLNSKQPDADKETKQAKNNSQKIYRNQKERKGQKTLREVNNKKVMTMKVMRMKHFVLSELNIYNIALVFSDKNGFNELRASCVQIQNV